MIDRERAYQDRKYGSLAQRQLTVAEYFDIADAEFGEMMAEVIAGDTDAALCEAAQVIAVLVAMLERHGIVERS